jgi:hypothetical protein
MEFKLQLLFVKFLFVIEEYEFIDFLSNLHVLSLKYHFHFSLFFHLLNYLNYHFVKDFIGL